MLNALVTSATRRAILKKLWVEGCVCSVSEMCRKTGLAYAGVYRELHALEQCGLAVESPDGKYAANVDHPLAPELKRIISYDGAPSGNPSVRSQLAAEGLPVVADQVESSLSLEETLVAGLHESRNDASIARAFPAFLAKRANDIEWKVVHSHLTRDSAGKHVLGFFLDVAAELTENGRYRKLAAGFRDGRRKSTHLFFSGSHSKRELQLAEMRTPDIARRWGWKMNMGLDAFADMYAKHASV